MLFKHNYEIKIGKYLSKTKQNNPEMSTSITF